MPSRACDRCHSIRARCQISSGQHACDRCRRLNYECRTDRKVLKAGRPRKAVPLDNLQPAELAHDDDASAQVPPDALRDFDPSEIHLARYFLQNQRFENSFIDASNFSITMQSESIRLLLSAPRQIKDALLALAGALISEDENASGLSTDDAIANMDRCCKAMETLRQLDSTSIDDSKAILFMATSLISFNDLTIGYGFLPIARNALLSIAPWYRELSSGTSSEFDPHLIPVIFAELSECVRSRDVPTFRYINPPTQIIDRSYGIAQEVLPQLYDICELSHDIKHGFLDTVAAKRRASEIHQSVDEWVPMIQCELTDHQELQLSELQKTKIVNHAACYKLLARLLLNQIQPVADRHDQTCSEIAAQIRRDITSSPKDTPPRVQYLLFPYFVACTELQDKSERMYVLDEMRYLSGGIASQSCICMFDFLNFVWATRDISPSTTWFDLVDEGAPMSIGP